MSLPRRVVPGRFLFASRRCTQRQFQLVPDEKFRRIFSYCLGEAAARFNILLLAWETMSNHYHMVYFDPDGRDPEFREHLNKMLAKAINALRGRSENLWSSDEPSVVELVTLEDVFEKVLYVLLNAVSASLVDSVNDWPGVHSLHHLDGRVTQHERPWVYFRKTGKVMPPKVTLRAVVPPGLGEREAAEWGERVRRAVTERERALREERKAKGIRILGRKGVLAMRPTDSPTTESPRRKLRPSVACKDPELRAIALKKLQAFRRSYARAWDIWSKTTNPLEKGAVVFPVGTYRLRRFGVPCEPYTERIAA